MSLGDWLVISGLVGVLIASIPTGWSALKHGNSVDPLGRQIEEERAKGRDGNQRAA